MNFRRLLLALLFFSFAAPATAQTAKTLRVVMHSDLKIIDPIWTTAYIVRNHGYLIYDTLFAPDDKLEPQPQMVESWTLSEDKLTWTFKLRDGLKWHDGQPVTSADVIPSIKRWTDKDSLGGLLGKATAGMSAVDDRTFRIALKEPFALMLKALAKSASVPLFIMPKRVAETPVSQQISDTTGSGPFIFKKDEWKPGEKTVYLRNADYKPRAEPPSGLAGGKVAKLDRVEWVWIPDSQTQVNALINGEIDMIGSLDFDNLPLLEKTKGIKILKATAPGQFTFRPNWLQPPFNDVRIRRAAAYALSQPDVMQANIGDPRFYKACKALFTCDTPYASTAGMDGLLEGNFAKAKELLAEAKYDGTPVVMPQPTDLGVIKQIAPVVKAQLEKAGFKVEVQPMDWQSMVTRLISKKGPPSEGGWNAYGTSWSQIDILDPLMNPSIAATCEKARAGWPCDPELEKLRDVFIRAETPAAKKAAAEAVQVRALEVVTHLPLGEWYGVFATRDTITYPAVLPQVGVFWGVTKK